MEEEVNIPACRQDSQGTVDREQFEIKYLKTDDIFVRINKLNAKDIYD